MLRIFVILSAVSLTFTLEAAKLFKICHTKDVNYDQCLMNSLIGMKPFLKSGSRELKLPPMEPMFVPKIHSKRGTGPVSVDSTFINLTISGTSDLKLTQVSTNLTSGTIRILGEIPQLVLVGKYEMKGKILVLPIEGKGDSNSIYKRVTLGSTLKIKPVVKNGESYMNVENFECDVHVRDASVSLTNLFDGNKELSDAVHLLIQNNWEVIFEEIKPIVESVLSAFLKDYSSKIFSRFPVKEIFPD